MSLLLILGGYISTGCLVGCGRLWGIWGGMWFCSGLVHGGEGRGVGLPFFGGFFTSIGEFFVLAGGGGWVLGIILWGLYTFLIFPNFLGS